MATNKVNSPLAAVIQAEALKARPATSIQHSCMGAVRHTQLMRVSQTHGPGKLATHNWVCSDCGEQIQVNILGGTDKMGGGGTWRKGMIGKGGKPIPPPPPPVAAEHCRNCTHHASKHYAGGCAGGSVGNFCDCIELDEVKLNANARR